MTRARRLPSVIALAAVTASAPAEPPYAFDRPAFLDAPDESTSLFGSTHAYLGRASGRHTRLLITLMPANEVRARLADLSDTDCINLFLDEIRNEHERFFVVAMARPMRVGAAEFLRFRWTGEKSGRQMTGVLSCGQLEGHYVVIHFSDELRAATRTFPLIRERLRAFALRPD